MQLFIVPLECNSTIHLYNSLALGWTILVDLEIDFAPQGTIVGCSL